MFLGTPGRPGFDFPPVILLRPTHFVLTRMVSSFSLGADYVVWMYGCTLRLEQLASVGHHSFAVKRPGIFLLAIVRGGALERAGGLGNCALEAKSARGSG